jgi:hypothetical protein
MYTWSTKKLLVMFAATLVWFGALGLLGQSLENVQMKPGDWAVFVPIGLASLVVGIIFLGTLINLVQRGLDATDSWFRKHGIVLGCSC